MADITTRQAVLDDAITAITGQRHTDYGTAEDNFTTIAELWATLFGFPVTATQVAQAMVLMKIARTMTTPDHRDSWVDIAGYSGCGYEVAEATARKTNAFDR